MYKKILRIYLDWLGFLVTGASLGFIVGFFKKGLHNNIEMYLYLAVVVMLLLTSGILLLMLVNSKEDKSE